MATPVKRCAIYTRKSSDEGLDQSFNSLDAQRAACEAYVLSQTSEGWSARADNYDDGGFSGSNTERPGLRQLLADIEAGKVDIVVVYKIDRLTRSLADFARIVEVFEKHDCSFVSVTQSFNTTGSMGKLMLNVLLSFAQFEREVTGERIRDKIAASKARGMWMGGMPPLGYDPPTDGTRILQVNETEAETVRHIFERYLELGSVHTLQRDLEERGIRSKVHTTPKNRTMGGQPIGRGALFYMLRNRIYLGQIVHKGEVHEGQHKAIIDIGLFDRVQASLDAKALGHRSNAAQRIARAPLTGKLFDAASEPMTPTMSRGKSGRSYRYYVSAPLQRGVRMDAKDIVRRLSATVIEREVGEAIRRWLPKAGDPFSILRSVNLNERGLHLTIDGTGSGVSQRLAEGEVLIDRDRDSVTIQLSVTFPAKGGRRLIVPARVRSASPDPVLIASLRKAHKMLTTERGLPTIAASLSSHYDRAIQRLALLAPDIQQAILEGRQPPHLNLDTFRKIDLPLLWSEQRKVLGFRDGEAP